MDWQPIETAPKDKMTVCYFRDLEIGAPIFNAEKTAKMVTMAFFGGSVVAIKINGKELEQSNYYVDNNLLNPTIYDISKNGGCSVLGDFPADLYHYRFLVNSGDTYQVIASVGPLSWIEADYTPEVSE